MRIAAPLRALLGCFDFVLGLLTNRGLSTRKRKTALQDVTPTFLRQGMTSLLFHLRIIILLGFFATTVRAGDSICSAPWYESNLAGPLKSITLYGTAAFIRNTIKTTPLSLVYYIRSTPITQRVVYFQFDEPDLINITPHWHICDTDGRQTNCDLITDRSISTSSQCSCPDAEVFNPITGQCLPTCVTGQFTGNACAKPDPKNNSSTCPSTNMPIAFGTGNKWLNEIDFSVNGTLNFVRYYNSNPFTGSSAFGSSWRSNYFQSLGLGSPTSVTSYRPDGKSLKYLATGSDYHADADVNEQLEQLKDSGGTSIGWRYITSNDEIEIYDTAGKLISITNRQGLTKTLILKKAVKLPGCVKLSGQLCRRIGGREHEFGKCAREDCA